MFHQSTCVVVDGVRADTEQQAAHRSRFNGGTNDRFEAGLRILEEACMNGLLFLGTPRRVGAAGKYEECGTDEYSQPGFEDMFDGKYHELEEVSAPDQLMPSIDSNSVQISLSTTRKRHLKWSRPTNIASQSIRISRRTS